MLVIAEVAEDDESPGSSSWGLLSASLAPRRIFHFTVLPILGAP